MNFSYLWHYNSNQHIYSTSPELTILKLNTPKLTTPIFLVTTIVTQHTEILDKINA